MNNFDLLPPDLKQLLQLFSSLPDVRFPDLDPTVLQEAVAKVKEREQELALLEAQRDAALAALDEEQEMLLRKGHRLHAYLKVFAEADEVLAAKVNAVSLPRLRKSPAASDGPFLPTLKKRGRPPKVPSTDALFSEEAPA